MFGRNYVCTINRSVSRTEPCGHQENNDWDEIYWHNFSSLGLILSDSRKNSHYRKPLHAADGGAIVQKTVVKSASKVEKASFTLWMDL